MTMDPFNEFPLLEKRQKKQFEYLRKVRDKIDLRISDKDIMCGYDMGFDMEVVTHDFFVKKHKKYDNLEQ